MKTLRDIPTLKNKKVLLRVDFDVPIKHGQIQESFRIKKQKETLDYLVNKGAKVIMAGHLHDPEQSFAELIPQLHMLLGYEISFLQNLENLKNFDSSMPSLLENVRSLKGEVENSKEFALSLSKGFDIYVNNDFAVCHRDNASVSAVTGYLPSYAGFLIEEEVANLKKAMEASPDGKIIIIGGAKASTKVRAIKNLLDKSEAVLTGGVIANDVLKARGQDVMDSVVDGDLHEIFMGISLSDSKLFAPQDYVIFENKILDIGAKTIERYSDMIKRASMIIWNGPMGMFEKKGFETGTLKIAETVAGSKTYKIIGGGDTIAALSTYRHIDISKFDFISTGGGAMLAFLAGDELPGLRALGYYQ